VTGVTGAPFTAQAPAPIEIFRIASTHLMKIVFVGLKRTIRAINGLEGSGKMSVTGEHATMVATLVKSGAAILEQLDPAKVDAMHAAIGIAGEAGELLDGVKKHVIYNKPLDRENLIEELGDLEFYMEQLRQNIGVTREETLVANMKKLAVRYNGMRYSDQAAQDRADKQ
jgi:NTP pyrophosphatase (non-canonical NTP hydrolase)